LSFDVTTDPPTLAYGTADTQFGVTCEQRPDGGVTVTIPGNDGRAIGHRLAGSEHWILGLTVVLLDALGRLSGRASPPRAVFELTPDHVAITEPDLKANFNAWAMQTRTWPLVGVSDLRPNRYSKGIYVRVPDKENFDLLTDLSKPLVQHVGRLLAEALERLKNAGGAS
jgi:hypothetical protein